MTHYSVTILFSDEKLKKLVGNKDIEEIYNKRPLELEKIINEYLNDYCNHKGKILLDKCDDCYVLIGRITPLVTLTHYENLGIVRRNDMDLKQMREDFKNEFKKMLYFTITRLLETCFIKGKPILVGNKNVLEIKNKKDMEEYLSSYLRGTFSTEIVIDKNGDFHEREDDGSYLSCDWSNSFHDKFIDNLDPTDWIIVAEYSD